LPQEHNVKVGEIFDARSRELEMRAVLILDRQALATRQKSIAMQREIGRCVIENVVPALLRFEQQRESRVADDVDPVDRVHLNGNAKGHLELSIRKAY
jgi:hypothetical protein